MPRVLRQRVSVSRRRGVQAAAGGNHRGGRDGTGGCCPPEVWSGEARPDSNGWDGEDTEAWPHAILLHAHRWWASATRTLPSYSPTRASLHARELETLPPSWHGRGPIAFGVWWGGGRLSKLCGWVVGSHVFGRPTARDFAGRAWSPLMSRTLWPIRRRSTRLSSRLAERLAAAIIRTRYRCRLTYYGAALPCAAGNARPGG